MENITLCSITGIRLFIIGCILTSITNFPAAFTHTSVNSAVLKIEEYLNNSFSGRFRPLETHEISLIKSGINTIWYVGQVVGAFLSPYICDNWGRKPAYVISTVVMAAACGMQMIASLTSFAEIFVIGRVITSVFSPLSDAALILYLQEISPSSYRGTMSSLFSTGYAIMCLIGMLLGHEDILAIVPQGWLAELVRGGNWKIAFLWATCQFIPTSTTLLEKVRIPTKSFRPLNPPSSQRKDNVACDPQFIPYPSNVVVPRSFESNEHGIPLKTIYMNVTGHSLPVLLFVPVIPGLIATLITLYIPETPKFLIISRNNLGAAFESLQFYQGKHESLLPEIIKLQLEGKSNDAKTKGGVKVIMMTNHLQKAFTISVAALVGTLPFFPILQNSTYFFTYLTFPNNVAQLSSSFLMVLFTCSCIIATLIVDKIPRRFDGIRTTRWERPAIRGLRAMLLTAGTSCIFSLCTFVIAADYGFKYVAMAGIFAFVFSYGIGVGPISWSIPPELVPLQNRSAMFCLCYAVHSVLVVLTNFSTIPLLETIGTVCFLPIYIIPCSLALMYVYAHLPETKGRDPLDILHELRGMSIKERMVDA